MSSLKRASMIDVSRKPSFRGGVISLIAGTIAAHAVTVALSPLLTRIYRPENFAGWGVLTAIVAIAGAIASGRLDLAAMNPESEAEARTVSSIGVLLAAATSLLVLLGGLLISLYAPSQWVAFHPDVFWCLALAISVFGYAYFQQANTLLNRQERYASMSGARIVQASVMAGISLLFGLLGHLEIGLIVGVVAGYTAGCVTAYVAGARISVNRAAMRRLAGVVSGHRHYLFIAAPAALADAASVQAIVLVSSVTQTVETAGLIAFSYRLLVLPIGIVGQATGRVFMQQALIRLRQQGSVSALYWRTARPLALMAFVFALLGYLLSPWAFTWIFGADWALAGQYARWLVMAIAVRLVVSPLSMIFFVTKSLQIMARWQYVYLCTSYTVLYLASTHLSLAHTLMVFAAHEFLLCGCYFLLGAHVASKARVVGI
jgi:O-antigen/teichoic acid export membrane protein